MKDSFKGRKVVLTACGLNIDLDLFKQIIYRDRALDTKVEMSDTGRLGPGNLTKSLRSNI